MSITFAHMAHNIHEGKKLRDLILKITTLDRLSEKIDKHRNTLTTWLKSPEVSNDKLILIGKGLRYDLTAEFPKLKTHPDSEELHYFNDDPAPYFNDLKKLEELVSDQKQKEADATLQVKMLQDKILDLKQIIDEKNHLVESKNQIIDMLREEIKQLKSGEKSA